MKKIVFLIAPFLLLAMTHCSSMSKTKVADREVVYYEKWGYGIFTLGGAPLSDCLEKMDKEGVNELIDSLLVGASGGIGIFRNPNTVNVTTSHRISTFTEACSAAGYVK